MKKTKLRANLLAISVAAVLGVSSPALMATGETTSGLSGTISQSGSKVANAEVVIKNVDTGLSRSVTSDAAGSYRFSQLPIGRYEVIVSKGGSVVAKDTVDVRLGGATVAPFELNATSGVEVIQVVGARPPAINFESADSGLVVGETQIDRLPVGRNLTSVTLLAPTVVEGDTAFGFLPSFAGATVGENVYYIDGFNTTDFRTGLGGSTVPFEFYKEWQVKSGGYSAEFGRSTGGVVNAIAKSGTNTFDFGVNVHYRPFISGFSGEGTDVDYLEAVIDPVTDQVIGLEKVRLSHRSEDRYDRKDVNIWASGPIIEDKLFFFALLNPRDISSDDYNTSEYTESTTDDMFWGGTVDWYITDDHLLRYTGFSDKNDVENVQLGYDYKTGVVDSSNPVLSTNKRGGATHIFRYTGNFTDDFTVSAMYGKGEGDQTDASPGDACPIIIDARAGTRVAGCWGNSFRGSGFDTRTMGRLDFDWYVNEAHSLKFGVDQEEYDADTVQEYSGGVYYRYVSGNRVRVREYRNNGSFRTVSNAIYLQDTWTLSDAVTLELGLRNEAFQNYNSNDDEFIDITNQIAPRLAMSWDAFGDGKTKVYATLGRYYLPVATNTNIRLAGGEYFTEQFFTLTGVNNQGQPNELPIVGAPISGLTVYADGSTKDPLEIVDQDIDPMYQDEFIIGIKNEFEGGWVGGVSFVRRDLKSTLEDMAVDAALNKVYCRDIAPGCDPSTAPFAHGFDYYVLGNPGQEITMGVDWDGDGTLERVTLSPEDLGYPKSERYYNAVIFDLSRPWDGQWSLDASYTWSQSYGNNEGYVRSDNGQDDAGLTTLFDQPGLMDGTFGYLPNDKRHQIKVWGNYALSDSWIAGFNTSIRSGRPKNCFGNHPTDAFAFEYGNESFYCGGELQPRGSWGRTPWITQLDVSIAYNTQVMGSDLTLKAQIFNLFDAQGFTEVIETGEEDGPDFTDQSLNRQDYRFGSASSFQTPRRIEFSAEMRF